VGESDLSYSSTPRHPAHLAKTPVFP